MDANRKLHVDRNEQEQIVLGQTFGSYLTSKFDVLAVLGFSLYLSWVFLIIVDALKVNSTVPNFTIGIVPFYFLGQLIAAGILWVLSKYLSNNTAIKAICIMTCFLLPLPGISMLFSGSLLQVLPAIWAVAGFGGLFLLALWGVFLSGLSHKNSILYPPVAVLVLSFIILMVLHLFRIEMVEVAMIVIPLSSVVLFFIWWRSALREERIQFFSNTKPPDWQALLRSSIAMVANNFLIGFVLYSISVSESSLASLLIIAMIICAATYKTYDAIHKQRFEVREIIKVLAPTAALGLLLLPYISFELRVACLCLMMFIAMLDEIVCWSAVSEYMHVYKLTPFANMAFGRLGDTIGCFLGYLCAFLVFGKSLEGEVSSPVVLSIVVIFFIIMQIFFFRDNYSPFTEHSEAERENESELYSMQKVGHWRERCNQFAEYHQLTPRQRETLIPFARGYSTKSIEEKLTVSSHTVKAHIYNIYRKTGVHTRQELIEAIECFDYIDSYEDDSGDQIS